MTDRDREYLTDLAQQCGVPENRIEEALQLEDLDPCPCGGACTVDTISILSQFAEECGRTQGGEPQSNG